MILNSIRTFRFLFCLSSWWHSILTTTSFCVKYSLFPWFLRHQSLLVFYFRFWLIPFLLHIKADVLRVLFSAHLPRYTFFVGVISDSHGFSYHIEINRWLNFYPNPQTSLLSSRLLYSIAFWRPSLGGHRDTSKCPNLNSSRLTESLSTLLLEARGIGVMLNSTLLCFSLQMKSISKSC